MNTNCIAIFAKPPIAGRTKARLAASIGEERAAELSEAMLIDLVDESARVGASTFLFYPPDSKPEEYPRRLHETVTFARQEGSDLGHRLENASFQLFTRQRMDKVLFVGSDCPTHCEDSLEKTLAVLERYDTVIEPSLDGGYVLLGVDAHRPALFREISWGTDRVLEQTLAAAHADSIRIRRLPPSFDVDTIDDLPALVEFLRSHPHRVTTTLLHKMNGK